MEEDKNQNRTIYKLSSFFLSCYALIHFCYWLWNMKWIIHKPHTWLKAHTYAFKGVCLCECISKSVTKSYQHWLRRMTQNQHFKKKSKVLRVQKSKW